MDRARLSAPTKDGAILAEPPLERVANVLEQNRSALENWRYDFQGRSADRLRAMTRAAVLDAAQHYTETDSAGAARSSILDRQSSSTSGSSPSALRPPPFIVTGHQPELFHPGVWIKNFASYEIARKYGGVSLHLIVDNDTVKRTTVRLPTGTPEQPSVVHVPLDRWRGEIPFEQYEVADESLFAGFGERVVAALDPLGVRPLAGEFWPLAIDAARRTPQLSERIAGARRTIEAAWGCHNLELPVGRLCQTEGFHWFACHLLAQLARFRDEYNQLLDDYRRRHRIRSHNHPVPSLARDGDWIEAPFWVWFDHSPRRRQLFVRLHRREMTLTDRDAWTQTLPLAPDREACCAVEVLADLARRGVKIRTRALTTTIFSRLCLTDLFIHGLGGARYDELTDEIVRRFFGLEPPRFLALTGTLHLPVPAHRSTAEQLHEIERLQRDLIYNPDRHPAPQVGRDGELAALIAAKREAIASPPMGAAERRSRFERIRQINGELGRFVESARADANREMEMIRADLAANAILLGRDWAFCAYPADKLREFFHSRRLAL
jgi:hypothetical protein